MFESIAKTNTTNTRIELTKHFASLRVLLKQIQQTLNRTDNGDSVSLRVLLKQIQQTRVKGRVIREVV